MVRDQYEVLQEWARCFETLYDYTDHKSYDRQFYKEVTSEVPRFKATYIPITSNDAITISEVQASLKGLNGVRWAV